MKVAIIKYNAGNTQSVIYTLNRLGIVSIVTDHEETLWFTDKTISRRIGDTRKTEFTTCTYNYIRPYASGIQKNNFYAVQFHPEKPGEIGAQIIQNFIEL